MQQARRTYIYLSKDKIDQQKQETPEPRWKRAFKRLEEVGVMVLQSGITVRIGPPAEGIIRDMQTVWQDLTDEKLIGDFDNPDQYFYGKGSFNYGFFNLVDPQVFFLLGATDRTIVGLGGSQKHVPRLSGRTIPVADGAQIPTAIMEPDVASLIYNASVADSAETPQITPGPGEDIRALHVALLYNNRQSWQGTMEFEVLAKTELQSRVSPPTLDQPKNVVIGTPIFVAYT